MKFFAVPALPAEQQDENLNPDGGPLGWVVVDQDDVIMRGRMFMERQEAEQIADTLNVNRTATDNTEGVVWTTSTEALGNDVNRRLGLVVAWAEIDGERTISNFSLEAWKRGEAVYGCDAAHKRNRKDQT